MSFLWLVHYPDPLTDLFPISAQIPRRFVFFVLLDVYGRFLFHQTNVVVIQVACVRVRCVI